MRDYLTRQFIRQPQCTTPDLEYGTEQVGGNQAAQTQVGPAAESPGFLDLLGFDALGGEVSASNPVHVVADGMSSDASLMDHADLLDAPTSITLPNHDVLRREQGKLALPGNVSVSPTGASFTGKKVHENEVLGTATDTMTGNVDVVSGTARLSGSHRVHGADGKVGNEGVGAFLQVGKDGQVVAGSGVKAGNVGASFQGMVDLGADGGLQAIGAGGTIEVAGVKAGVTGAVQLGSVDVKGNEVSRTFGANAGVDGTWGPVGGNVGQAWSYGESVTFATEAEAKTYVKELQNGDHARVADLTARDIQALPDGARAEYVWQASAKAGGAVVVKPEAHAKASQKVSIAKKSGDVVELTVETEGVLGAGIAVDNGFMGTSGSLDGVSEDHAIYVVDLAKEEEAAAFERFQATGDRTGLKLVKSEELSGTRAISKAHGGGFAVTEANERLSGERRDASGVSAVDRGGYADEGSSRWDVYGAVATAAGLAGDALGMGPVQMTGLGAAGAEGLEGWARAKQAERYAEVGTTNGKQSGQLDVLTREDDGTTLALGEQMVDFDDQQENARFLQDQVTPGTDGLGIDPALLPPHAKSDNAWKLETTIHPAGIQNIEDVLASGAPLPCESAVAIRAWMGARDAYGASEGTSADLRDAIADTAEQGEDAMECAGVMAGEENVERFLSREGDEVWMGAEEHARFDDRLANVIDGAKQGVPADTASLDTMRVDHQERLSRLTSEAHPEVPDKMLADEILRIERRLARMVAE